MHPSLLLLSILLILTACKRTREFSDSPIPNNKALTWAKTFGGTNYDMAKAVIQLPDGGFVFAGATRSSNGDIPGSRAGYDAWIARTDAAGNKVWSQAFGTSNDEYVTALVAMPDNGFLLAGYTFLNTRTATWVARVDGSGNRLWQKDVAPGADSRPEALMALENGRLVMAGTITTAGSGQDGWVAQLDPSGNTLWSKRFGSTGQDGFSALLTTADGSIMAAGHTESGTTGDPAAGWITRLDASGTTQWSKTFGGAGKDYFKGIVPAGDGGFVAGGYSNSTDGDLPRNRGGFDGWFLKVDATGNRLWSVTYGGNQDDFVYGLCAARAGGFATVGTTNSNTHDIVRKYRDQGGWVLRLDASGNKTAASTYDQFEHDDYAHTLIGTSDGGFLLAGYSWAGDNWYDGWLVKVTAF